MSRRSRAVWALILLLLTPAVVVPLMVPLFDQVDPTLAGFPFFFWFQLALILFSCLVTGIAFFLARHADRLDREDRARAGDR
jgi:uncharacterized membrane protein YhdT